MENYSVLMSVYHKEKAQYLRESIKSVMEQTVPPDDFVLVCDGPLTKELDAEIENAQQKYGKILQVVRLERNQGLKNALNAGLPLCKYELGARMDSDDICHKERAKMQLQCFRRRPDLGIVSGTVEEFAGSIDHTVSVKTLPRTDYEIRKYAKLRSPFNHPAVMYKKTLVLGVGGYPGPNLYEDYALWINLLAAGVKGHNLPQTLVYMRVDSGLYGRRGGWEYVKKAADFRWRLYKEKKYCSLWESLYSICGAAAVALVPTNLRKRIYRGVLRK